MTDKMTQDLIIRLREFARERDWEQFHTPKNLAMALNVEAGELLELFQWLTPDQSRKLDQEQARRLRQELADVFLYLLQLADVCKVDLNQAALEKLSENAEKYPADAARGRADKYTVYGDKKV